MLPSPVDAIACYTLIYKGVAPLHVTPTPSLLLDLLYVLFIYFTPYILLQCPCWLAVCVCYSHHSDLTT